MLALDTQQERERGVGVAAREIMAGGGGGGRTKHPKDESSRTLLSFVHRSLQFS